MANFFKRSQDDHYEALRPGTFSKELRESISTEDSFAPTKSFFVSLGRFLVVFLIVFSVVLTGYWLWRDNGVTNSPVVNEVVSQEGANNEQPASVAAVSSQDEEIITAVTTDITETGVLIEITLWSLIAGLILFTCLATMSHRLVHNLLKS